MLNMHEYSGPAHSFVPILDVPVDLPFVTRVLILDPNAAKLIYNERLSRSVTVGLQRTVQFDWPNIYDLIEYIIKSSLDELGKRELSKDIACLIVDELASYREFLSFEPVSPSVLISDPSGLTSALESLSEVVSGALQMLPGSTSTLSFSSALCSKIQNCVSQFNQYLSELTRLTN